MKKIRFNIVSNLIRSGSNLITHFFSAIKAFFNNRMKFILQWIGRKILSFLNFISNSSNWLPIIVATIAISGLWNLLGYFSPSVSLNIMKVSFFKPWENIDSLAYNQLSSRGNIIYSYDLEEFGNFYRVHDFPIPYIATVDSTLNRLLNPQISKKHTSTDGFLTLDRSDIELLSLNKLKPSFLEGALQYLITDTEKQLDTLRWHRTKYSREILIGNLGEFPEKENRLIFKKYMSDLEYYTYLCALLYSRKVENDIRVENNSEIALEDIQIFVQNPESRLAYGRDNTILEAFPAGEFKLIHRINIDEDFVRIEIPRMNPGQFINFRILTKESEIDGSEILSSYKENPTIDKKQAIKVTLVIFFTLLFLQFLCFKNGKHSAYYRLTEI